jgi:hypothetical protein
MLGALTLSALPLAVCSRRFAKGLTRALPTGSLIEESPSKLIENESQAARLGLGARVCPAYSGPF